jgi:hypothetical protein
MDGWMLGRRVARKTAHSIVSSLRATSPRKKDKDAGLRLAAAPKATFSLPAAMIQQMFQAM